jgi:hypothetical protein
LAAAAVAGCGGSSASRSSAGTTAANAAAPNGEARKPASQILADMKVALGRVHSFHLQGTGADLKTGPMALTGDIALPGRIRMAISQGNQTAAFILVGRDAYLRPRHHDWGDGP